MRQHRHLQARPGALHGVIERARRQIERLHPALLMGVVGVIVITLLASVAGIQSHVAASDQQASGRPGAQGTPVTSNPQDAHSSAIARENANVGTNAWLISPEQTARNQIQAYASATSVLPGQRLTFHVSVQQDGMPYSIDVYRLGWYGGLGGRLMLDVQQRVGHAQGYYDAGTHTLVGCSSCTVDQSVGLVEAHWQPSYVLTVPTSWTTGVYEAKFTDANDKQTSVSFDVAGSSRSTYLAITAVATEAAYNTWGGYSLYVGPDDTYGSRAFKVSLNRPTAGVDSTEGLNFEIDTIRWLERMGYDVTYTSGVDLHEHPEQLRTHRAVLILGHSEHWSKEMRDGVEAARDAGVGLAFLGGGDVHMQIRFEPAGDGTPDRTIVGYRDAALDPLNGVDNARVTVEWRSPPVSRPENALTGLMYSSYTQSPSGFPWQLSSWARSPLLEGTGLQRGQSYGCDIVGYVWDEESDHNGATPAGLNDLGASPTRTFLGTTDAGDTTYYVASSGALVFDAGTVNWGYALDSFRLVPPNDCSGQTAPVPGLQKLMSNVMAALIVKQSHP